MHGANGASKAPYLADGSDKTSSWVDNLKSNPPPPPEDVGTVVEPAPEVPGSSSEERHRDERRRRRTDGYRDVRGRDESESEDDYRDRRRSRRSPPGGDYYNERATPKKQGWFKKLVSR